MRKCVGVEGEEDGSGQRHGSRGWVVLGWRRKEGCEPKKEVKVGKRLRRK
jgi:hypothetical protein